MKTYNIWLAISDAAQDVVLEYLRWDTETQGEYTGPLRRRSQRLCEYMQDETNRRRLFSKPTLAGTVYNLWSIDFEDDPTVLQEVEDEILYLQGEYPNQISVLGAWKADGAMVGCQLVLTEVPNPDYVGEPFMIPNPDFNDDPESPDYDPRTEIRNPLWVPETITERSQTGTPRYPLPNFLWQFLPAEDGATSNADLRDVNLLFGQAKRVFS